MLHTRFSACLPTHLGVVLVFRLGFRKTRSYNWECDSFKLYLRCFLCHLNMFTVSSNYGHRSDSVPAHHWLNSTGMWLALGLWRCHLSCFTGGLFSHFCRHSFVRRFFSFCANFIILLLVFDCATRWAVLLLHVVYKYPVIKGEGFLVPLPEVFK